MAAMVSMAAAIGVPVLAYDRGLLPSTIIAVVVVLIARFSANLNHRNVKMEKLTIGDVSIIVEDGIINQKEILMSKLPRERVLADLRSQSVIHLGEVKRLYMESNGDFSLIRNPQPGQGLLAIPENDEEFVEMMTERTDTEICLQCGTEINQRNNGNGEKKCSNCGSQVFTYAVRKK